MNELAIETLLAQTHGGAEGSVTPPIYQSSLFTFDDFAAFEARMSGQGNRTLYSRVQYPTVAAFEQMMARLENGAAAVGFASGMAAISSTIFAHVRPGDRIACIEHVYPDAYRLFEQMLRPWGVEITYHPMTGFESDPDLLNGVRPAYLESPNSMMMQVTDLRRTAEHAKRHGTLTVVDNSWATPVFQ